MSTSAIKPTGLLLAGGKSRRMSEAFAEGRGDKGLLDIAGKPMLGHVIERLSPQVGAMVINANGDPERFAAFRLPVVADTIEGFAGPLAGILAGLRWSQANAPEATHVVSVSTDAPFLPGDLVAKLQTALANAPGAIALARSEGTLHPVIGLWPVALADDLEEALRAGTRKVLAWTDRHGTVPVDFPLIRLKDRVVDPFFNANTPDELAQARELLAG
jgi:molybdopterin-guanine dinucleotide biosynthesis protein A